MAAIGDVLQSGTLNADDQSKAIAALSKLYGLDHGDPGGQTDPDGSPQPTPGQQPGTSAAPAPSAPPGEPVDPGLLGPGEPLPDPTLGDLGMGPPLGPDPLSSLASTLPAALGGIPPLSGTGGSPLDSLGGLAGPLAGLGSQLGDLAAHRDEPGKDDSGDDKKTSHDDTDPAKDNKDNQQPQPVQQPAAGQQPPQPQPNGTPGEGAPPAAQAPAPAPPTTSVQLPDGSTGNARTPALAAAVKSYLAGTPLDVAYRQAGIELPPPGTPVTNPIDPSQLTAGAIGMFKDHYVVALSAAKAFQDGQVVSLASAASGPDFLGWIDPSTLGATAAAAQQPASANPAVPLGQLPPAGVAAPPARRPGRVSARADRMIG